ncbi:CsiV family protein [Marinobacterium weihaiense]|uniref:Peptidoglycan binding protein CsiV n=1 Tax=Marinobacterium weihaiense TaxID=2851016 RepID=A0ABS6M7A5_9GAMM|nr:CsiV family protein [Marinobacterium weihaiense]MBV0932166.1 peptidoglycan binding protein CsiV [Marinobacterium weihaiense]
MASSLRRSLALAAMAALPTLTQAASLYKVEMLVFSHENTAADLQQEYWPQQPPLDLSGAVHTQPWDGYPLANFEELPPNDRFLAGSAAALQRDPNYRVIYHGGWLQSIGAESRAREVRISASQGKFELDGSIRLHKQRFLHAHPVIDLKTHDTGAPARNNTPESTTDSGQAALTAAALPDAIEDSLWRLDQTRRMRSNETHYIDHPRFGILLRIRALN